MAHPECHFNPHSHKESDQYGTQLTIYYFNPHSHKESDSTYNLCIRTISNFNPHSHKKSDTFGNLPSIRLVISIHTLTKRVTTRNLHFFLWREISIHTLTKRVTNLLDCHKDIRGFQSTLSQRE